MSDFCQMLSAPRRKELLFTGDLAVQVISEVLRHAEAGLQKITPGGGVVIQHLADGVMTGKLPELEVAVDLRECNATHCGDRILKRTCSGDGQGKGFNMTGQRDRIKETVFGQKMF